MKGKVYLVGAGPGKVDLITVRGQNLLKEAEVLVYDRLANPELLDLVPKSCETIYVGKISNQHTMKQEDINQLLVDKAMEHKVVVRLKGGDPYVFGRGGEEGITLFDHNIPFEVVPGITSAIGGLCFGGIPITHRDVSTSFHVITGHLRSGEDEHDWSALARLNGTLVCLMGMSNLPLIVERLIVNGKDKNTPVGIVHWATHPHQQVVEGTLETIVDEIKKSGIGSPSLIVVGDVVSLRNKLDFKSMLPLAGKRIMITRATLQSSKVKRQLEELGAHVLCKPLIEIKPLVVDLDIFRHLSAYQYIVFTSLNGVELFFENLLKTGLDVRALSHSKIICIGHPTEKALRSYGLKADAVPDRFVAEGLIDLMTKMVKPTDKILIPRAKNARPLLVDDLSKLAKVEECHLYETIPTKEAIQTSDLEGLDYITFTSASTVTNYHAQMMNHKSFKGKMVSIGPVTTKKLRALGYPVDLEALNHTIEGLVEVIKVDVKECLND